MAKRIWCFGTTQDPIVKDVIKEGRRLSQQRGLPLMYAWHGKKYWGAAHGLAGIMHVLMDMQLNPEEQESVKGTLRYMIQNRFPSGNYPSSEGSSTDRLVHWCHGAPGVALTLCKAAKVFLGLLSFTQCMVFFYFQIFSKTMRKPLRTIQFIGPTFRDVNSALIYSNELVGNQDLNLFGISSRIL